MRKYSIYNVELDLDSHKLIVYNTLSKRLNIVSKDAWIKRENSLLASNGYLVSDDCIEFDEACQVYYRIVNNLSDAILTVMVTDLCNMNCSYCFENRVYRDELQELSFMKFVRKILDSKCKRLIIRWYGGEPLLKLDLIQRLSSQIALMAKEYRCLIFGTITTNGTMLSLECFNMLVKSKVYLYQITIDGEKENHDKHRRLINGDATYSTIINNLIDISKNSSYKYCKIVIRTNVTKDSVCNLHKHLETMHKLFGEDSRFEFLIRPVENMGVNCGENEFDFYGIMDELRVSPKLNFNPFYLPLANGICDANMPKSFTIMTDGSVVKCTTYLDQHNRVGTTNQFDVPKPDVMQCTKKWDEQCKKCVLFPLCYNSKCPIHEKMDSTKKCQYSLTSVHNTMKILALYNSSTLYCGTIE